MRAEIEQSFDMDATDIYGLSEVMGPGVAQECIETKDGLHIWEDHFYPEVIDPETGAVLPDGEKGELVFTSLTKEAFPVIRYRTRDLTRLLPGTARPGMRRMEKVTGRSDDMIILRGVNVFPTQIEEVLLATDWCGGHFVIELTREGRMDVMTVLAEARRESWDGRGLIEQTAQVTHHIKNTTGIHANIRAVAPGLAGALARQGQARVRQAAEGLGRPASLAPRRDILLSSMAASRCGASFLLEMRDRHGRFPFTYRSRVGRFDPRQEAIGRQRRARRAGARRAAEGSQRVHRAEPGGRAGRRCAGRCGQDNRCACRPADRGEGQYQHRRFADLGRHAGAAECPSQPERALAQKLLDAGAIVIGKANMHELAFGITSTNLSSFAGPVKNPYDKSRIPGGSSGGTAAAIAARIATCGLGSDTGGSTRVPAALTGTVGLAALGRQWRRRAAL